MKTMNFWKTTAFAVSSLGLMSAMASVELSRQIEEKKHSIEIRRGLEMDLSIKALYQRAAFESSGELEAEKDSLYAARWGISTSPDIERVGFTQLDLGLLARPWDQARARVNLRLFGGSQDFFNNPTKIVSVPWMSLDGRLGKDAHMAVYEFGDYRAQISPLTLWTPDVEILYEPLVFARKRHMAKQEMYLEGNARNLQGGQVQYRSALGIFENRAEILGARLRRAEQLDVQGATGNLLPTQPVNSSQAYPPAWIPGASQSANMDKYMLGVNLEELMYKKTGYLGLSWMQVKDLKSSFVRVRKDSLDASGQVEPKQLSNAFTPWNLADTLPQNTSVISLRAGFSGDSVLPVPGLKADLALEYAMSNDDVYSYGALGEVIAETRKGNALLADLDLGYGLGDVFNARLNVKYLNNNPDFFNSLAQSPSFVPGRILNSDKDPHEMRWGARSPLYSAFDALYNYNPRFSPWPVSLNADGTNTTNVGIDITNNSDQMSGSNSYQIAPMSKGSYTAAVMTRQEMALAQVMMDPSLQTTLPFGLATPNRRGVQMRLTAGLLKQNAVEFTALLSALSEAEASLAAAGLGALSFSDLGGGVKIGLNALLGWELPLEISGSYTMSSAKAGAYDVSSKFLNAGLYGRFHKRFGAFFGWQQIDLTRENTPEPVALTKSKQYQWSAGLDYSLADHMWVSVGYSAIDVVNRYRITGLQVQNNKFVSLTPAADVLAVGYLLPAWYNAGADNADVTAVHSYESPFNQGILEASVNVDF